MKETKLYNPILDSCQVQYVVSENDLRSILEDIVTDTIIKYDESNKAEKYLSTDEVMDMLKITRPTLWRWARDKYLVPVKVGKRTLYKASEVEVLMK